MISVPIPTATHPNFKAGENYFPDLTDNFFTTNDFPACGVTLKATDIMSEGREEQLRSAMRGPILGREPFRAPADTLQAQAALRLPFASVGARPRRARAGVRRAKRSAVCAARRLPAVLARQGPVAKLAPFASLTVL